ncbi:MAG: hypothetical protein ACNI27_13075 [Desulfovibrio sp.]
MNVYVNVENKKKRARSLNKIYILLVIMTLTVTNAHAVLVHGEGTTEDLAIKRALQQAIEGSLGITIAGGSKVVDGKIIHDFIVSNAQGYIKNYTLIKKEKIENTFAVTVDAEVARELIASNKEMLSLILKLAHNPRVAVFTVAEELGSIPLHVDTFKPAIQKIEKIFAEDFQFTVLNTGNMAIDQYVEAKTRAVDAQYAVILELTEIPKVVSQATLSISIIRPSDNVQIAQESITIHSSPTKNKTPLETRSALCVAIEEQAMPIAVLAASELIKTIQEETEGTTGLRYSISFTDFFKYSSKGHSLSEKELTALCASQPGFVGITMNKKTGRDIVYTYRSHQSVMALRKTFSDTFHALGIRFQSKTDGRKIKFKRFSSDGF